ncbi:barstar family protein [Saccharothrix sp. AJ9571]|nr:barstar family protein [Saccharothrix sp. AJ9571]
MSAVEQPDARALAERARARGAYAHVLPGPAPVTKAAAMDAIAAALDFPDWFGRNLDALYDCLTDLSWLPAGEHVLIWAGSEAFKTADPKAYLAIRGVLSDAQRALTPNGARRDSRSLTVQLPEA